MQEQVEDQELAGLARSRPVAARPVASTDPTILGPAPAPLDCPYLHLDDDGAGCLALAPAIRLSRRQVEIVCAVAAHLACPRLIKADAGRVSVPIEPPPAIARRRDGRLTRSEDAAGPTTGAGTAAAAVAADTATTLAASGATAAVGATAAAVGATVAAEEPAATIATVAAAEPATTLELPTTPEPAPTMEPARPAGSSAAGEPLGVPPPPAEGPVATGRLAATGAPDATPATPSRVAAALTLVRATARTHIVLRPATAAAWVIFAATLVIVIALLAARGGLTLPAASSASPGLVQGSPSVAVSSPSSAPSPSATPSATPSPSASVSTPPSPSPSPSAPPSPSASPPFPPAQLAVLTPCPGKAGCYQYRIKPNDNLRSLAKFFGVSYAALLAANPQITNPSIIHVGERITIPIPTATPSATPKP